MERHAGIRPRIFHRCHPVHQIVAKSGELVAPIHRILNAGAVSPSVIVGGRDFVVSMLDAPAEIPWRECANRRPLTVLETVR